MKSIIFIDAPTASGKTQYIYRKMEEYKAEGKRTLFLMGIDMYYMIRETALITSRDGQDKPTPLLSFELEYDVVAVDDLDVCLAGKHAFQEIFTDFAIKMANQNKTVIISGINLKNRLPLICSVADKYAEWLSAEDLK